MYFIKESSVRILKFFNHEPYPMVVANEGVSIIGAVQKEFKPRSTRSFTEEKMIFVSKTPCNSVPSVVNSYLLDTSDYAKLIKEEPRTEARRHGEGRLISTPSFAF